MISNKFSTTNLTVDAVREALQRERAKRKASLKPIEIVKVTLSAYLSYTYREECTSNINSNPNGTVVIESADTTALRRGTQSAIDHLLFNANYWCAAYESRIIAACTNPKNAQACLEATSVWNTHTLRLNTLSPDETIATFERFCPPFAINNRKGSHKRNPSGKGPLPGFKKAIDEIAQNKTEPQQNIRQLYNLLTDMEAEAGTYEATSKSGTLGALFSILPAWCLQNRIALVNGDWWDNYDVMSEIIDALYNRFIELEQGIAVCQYFRDSCYEALDAYHRDLSSSPDDLCILDIPQLIGIIKQAREEYPNFETDGYGHDIPSWLISKEQLIWNIIVCALYGPASARPLLMDSPTLLAGQSYTAKTDVITKLAQTSFQRYTADRIASQTNQEFNTFASLPTDLRNSSIAYISSIHDKLDTLGYEVLPMGSCYLDRRVSAFTASEVECLAILEHRRWLHEREKAGWRYGSKKNVERKLSPYMVPWEELPDRAKEWNRSAVRSIPNLLASVNLAIVK